MGVGGAGNDAQKTAHTNNKSPNNKHTTKTFQRQRRCIYLRTCSLFFPFRKTLGKKERKKNGIFDRNGSPPPPLPPPQPNPCPLPSRARSRPLLVGERGGGGLARYLATALLVQQCHGSWGSGDGDGPVGGDFHAHGVVVHNVVRGGRGHQRSRVLRFTYVTLYVKGKKGEDGGGKMGDTAACGGGG